MHNDRKHYRSYTLPQRTIKTHKVSWAVKLAYLLLNIAIWGGLAIVALWSWAMWMGW